MSMFIKGATVSRARTVERFPKYGDLGKQIAAGIVGKEHAGQKALSNWAAVKRAASIALDNGDSLFTAMKALRAEARAALDAALVQAKAPEEVVKSFKGKLASLNSYASTITKAEQELGYVIEETDEGETVSIVSRGDGPEIDAALLSSDTCPGYDQFREALAKPATIKAEALIRAFASLIRKSAKVESWNMDEFAATVGGLHWDETNSQWTDVQPEAEATDESAGAEAKPEATRFEKRAAQG